MTGHLVSPIYRSDRRGREAMDALLTAQGLRLDRNLDYSCAIFDPDGQMIATGSSYGNTLRCLAVHHQHRGEALLNTILTHLLDVQAARGNTHVFLYTTDGAAPFFADLGFHQIARVDDEVVFMENRHDGFARYLDRLAAETSLTTAGHPGARIGAVVLNANPFSLGHRHLLEFASAKSDLLHVFLVSEDASLFPFDERRRLVTTGTADLGNLIHHDTGSYLVSQATFPSYFQPDDHAVTHGQAMLDVTIFGMIAQRLGINQRFVGTERAGTVTAIYNQTMADQLPHFGVRCIEIPRLTVAGQPISASTIRQAIRSGDLDHIRVLVPTVTWRYLTSKAAGPVLATIRAAEDVVHH